MDILTAEARQELSEVFSGRSAGEYVIQQANGQPVQPKSVTKALERACKKSGVDLPTYNKNHAFRKLFAQESYNHMRVTGVDKQTALNYATNQLGHGDNRRDLANRYIQDQW